MVFSRRCSEEISQLVSEWKQSRESTCMVEADAAKAFFQICSIITFPLLRRNVNTSMSSWAESMRNYLSCNGKKRDTIHLSR